MPRKSLNIRMASFCHIYESEAKTLKVLVSVNGSNGKLENIYLKLSEDTAILLIDNYEDFFHKKIYVGKLIDNNEDLVKALAQNVWSFHNEGNRTNLKSKGLLLERAILGFYKCGGDINGLADVGGHVHHHHYVCNCRREFIELMTLQEHKNWHDQHGHKSHLLEFFIHPAKWIMLSAIR